MRMAREALGTLLLAACSGAAGPGPGPGDPEAVPDEPWADAAPAPPKAPRRPRPPALEPCPAGWSPLPDAQHPEIVTCDPWRGGGHPDCGPDEALFPGAPGCARVGTACPTDDDWASDLPDDPGVDIVYVRPGGVVVGDGSRQRPASTIARGLTLADDGAVIALAKGRYDETVWIEDRRDVTLWGACAAETVLAPPPAGPEEAPAVLVLGTEGARLRNLQIHAARIGLSVFDSHDVAVESVVVRDPGGFGLVIGSGSEVTGSDLVVRGAAANPGDGVSLTMFDGSLVSLSRAAFERHDSAGVVVDGPGTTLMAEDVAIWGAGPEALLGLTVQSEARAVVSRLVVGDQKGFGVETHDAGSTLEAHHLVIQDVVAQGADVPAGLAVGLDAQADVSAAWLHGNVEGAVVVELGATLRATDLVVTDTTGRPGATDDAGMALQIDHGGDATVEHAALLRSTGAALWVSDEATALLTDFTILDTAAFDFQGLGLGVGVANGGHVELHRAELAGNRGAAVLLQDEGTTLEAFDLAARGTAAGAGGLGTSLQIAYGATASLHAVDFAGDLGASVQLYEGRLDGEDVSLVGARMVCGDQGCLGGIGLFTAGTATLTRFRIADNPLCGVEVASGDADLHEGVVERNATGARVVAPDFDVLRLQDRVLYRDNAIPIDLATVAFPPAPPRLPDLSRH